MIIIWRFLLILNFLLVPIVVQAQISQPRISPASTITQTIGLTNFEVDYSRPGMRGRQLLGELIPYGRIWRVGANESTKLKISHDILVNGEFLKSGVYALYAFPEIDAWEVVFHSDTSHWGDGCTNYNPEDDALRVISIPYFEENVVENFRIDFQDLDHNSGKMVWAWGLFRIAVDLTVFTDESVMLDIEQQVINNPTALTFYQSARYFQEQEKEQEKALIYLDKAEELEGPKYYIYRVRALVLAHLSRFEEAIRSAEISKSLADSEGKDEFVRLNEGYIKEWTQLNNQH